MAAYFLPALFAQGIKGGLFVFIFIQFFKGLPKELEDAAYIDGCGRVHTFFRIMLPSSSAPFLTVTLFSVVWYWNDFFYNSMYFNNLPVVSKVLQNIKMLLGSGLNTSNPYDVITQTMASAMLAILPLLIIYILLQRYFTESIERTGIVG
jgi:multiple sugar transport system permease protein